MEHNIPELSSASFKVDLARNRAALRVKSETNASVEIKKGIPEITIDYADRQKILSEIVQIYGPNTVYRVFNSAFAEDVLEYGTDKALVDVYDFRRVTPFNGLDVWGVEKTALNMGLKRADAFCANPYFIVARDNNFDSNGLGVPNDRSAITIYKEEKLTEIDRTDGYVFKDPSNKKDAVLAVIKINEVPTDFEIELNKATNIEQKISILRRVVENNIKSHEDLVNCPYIYFNVIRILRELYRDPAAYKQNAANIEKLTDIANLASNKTRSIDFSHNMRSQLTITKDAYAQKHGPKMRAVTGWPDFVIQTTLEHLESGQVEESDKAELMQIVEDAKRLKKELGI